MLLRGATAEDLDRLDYYEGGFGYETALLRLAAPEAEALVYLPPAGAPVAGPWSLADWQRDWAEVAVATAADVMALRGQRAAADVVRRYRLMLVRGASRVRAAATPRPPAATAPPPMMWSSSVLPSPMPISSRSRNMTSVSAALTAA
ncbi:hypothetical protein ACFSHQ_12035 [Gemmobacter lanyuensis]